MTAVDMADLVRYHLVDGAHDAAEAAKNIDEFLGRLGLGMWEIDTGLAGAIERAEENVA